MPFEAIYKGRKKPPRPVPEKTDVECPTCGGRMRVVKRGKDGTARHFRHIRGSGGGGSACETVAEEDRHKVWKSFAADKIEAIFEDNCLFCEMEKSINAPYTGKEWRDADALLLFEERDEQLGQGIAVEVQNKNTSKDVQSTTKDYIQQDIAVVWLTEDDFSKDRCSLNEFDFRKRAKEAVWPHHIPEHGLNTEMYMDAREYINELSIGLSAKVPATLPREWHDEKSRELWESKTWDELFDPPMSGQYILRGVLSAPPNNRLVEAKLTPEIIDSLYYENNEWFDIVSGEPPIKYPDTEWSHKREVPINRWVGESGPTRNIAQAMEYAHAKTLTEAPTSPAEKKEALERVRRIVDYNTGGPQPDHAKERVVFQIGNQAGLPVDGIKWALRRHVINGDLEQTGAGYRLTESEGAKA